MTIAIGYRPQNRAFGGGQRFLEAMTAYFVAQGHTVVHTLTHTSIDAIILTEPRFWSASSSFSAIGALWYKWRHPRTILIHRINECDERKGRSPSLHNQLLQKVAGSADHVVFVSEWLRRLHVTQAPSLARTSSTIHSAANISVFNSSKPSIWSPSKQLRIVTHHWSAHWNKGWDIYAHLDTLLGARLHDSFQFTVIGNVPTNLTLQHTRVLPPLQGEKLATELKRHHVYISASLNEPGGMHYIEAMQCGLPILYRDSGSLPEYCSAYGEIFTGQDNVVMAIHRMRKNYLQYKEALAQYSYTPADMCRLYAKLLTKPARYKCSWPSILLITLLSFRLFMHHSLEV